MRKIEVLEKSIEISVYQKSKTVWIAEGTYVGKAYRAQGRTEPRAMSAWARAVTYQNANSAYPEENGGFHLPAAMDFGTLI
jgi:hypothetical protein